MDRGLSYICSLGFYPLSIPMPIHGVDVERKTSSTISMSPSAPSSHVALQTKPEIFPVYLLLYMLF